MCLNGDTMHKAKSTLALWFFFAWLIRQSYKSLNSPQDCQFNTSKLTYS